MKITYNMLCAAAALAAVSAMCACNARPVDTEAANTETANTETAVTADASAGMEADDTGAYVSGNDTADPDQGSDDAGSTESSSYELMDYFGLNVEDISRDFPGLEISVNEGIYDKGGTQYIDRREKDPDGLLLGPTFDADSDQNIVGIEYSGTKHSLNKLTKGMPMSDASDMLKQEGWELSGVDLTHGTSQIYVIYEKDDMEICVVSDAEGEFGHTEESDVKGNVDIISVSKKI